MIPLAKDWFREYAIFNVPPDPPPEQIRTTRPSASSTKVNVDHVNSLDRELLPLFAFRDDEKVDRLLEAAERALGDKQLKGYSNGNGDLSDDAVIDSYAELFSPRVEERYGVKRDEWMWIEYEQDATRLIRSGLIYAIKSILARLFGRQIISVETPLHPLYGDGGPITDAGERVDIVIMNPEYNHFYALCEAKRSAVLKNAVVLTSHYDFLLVDFSHVEGLDRQIMYKAFFYMVLWKCKFMWLSSFEFSIILQMHQTSVGAAVSYSQKLNQDGRSEPFRALLGMMLAQLGEVTVRDPDLDKQVEKYRAQEFPRKPFGGSGGGPRGGSGGNGWNDIHPNWLEKTERTSGKGKKRGNSGQGGRTSGSKKSVRRPHAITNKVDPIISLRLTRSASRQLMSHNTSKTDKGSTPVIRIAGIKCLGPDLERNALFELVPGVQFPSFPSTAEVPFLRVVGGKGTGATGILYKTQLRKADGTKHFYALKLVDGLRPGRGNVNFCADLYNEYINYSLLQVAKHDKHLEEVINRVTTACFGLYRLKDCSWFMLITEWAGEPLKESWVIPENGDKDELLASLTLFHSLGLEHRDCDEKNIVFNPKTKLFKFIDLCDAVWHDCPGFCDCEEMVVRWEILNDGSVTSVNPLEFQRRVMDKYGMEFCNLRKVLAWDGLVNIYDLGKCLREFADGYEESRKEAKVNFLGYNYSYS
ncbi:hypothetical protein A7U60_g5261 [Sanghuangporus baumii]|uniref:Protein kinase domain-containing protein n=1 Tax=Sanghuangporus baumii TaxID=108892 RepID=A0A9Q5HXL3_SANBA|nr:hypothetical protein A7U60_g5261 [Sanghuangporus baumii]